MAESALSIRQPQCLDRRSPDAAMLKRESVTWAQQRNTAQATMDGRFSVSDARHKLKRLYPSLPS